MHVCQKCGESNPVANRYCLNCGAELQDVMNGAGVDTAASEVDPVAERADDAVIEQYDTSALRFP